MNRFKKITHVLAIGLGTLAGLAASPEAQGIIAMHPKLAGIAAAIIGLAVAAGVYHNPKEPRPIN